MRRTFGSPLVEAEAIANFSGVPRCEIGTRILLVFVSLDRRGLLIGEAHQYSKFRDPSVGPSYLDRHGFHSPGAINFLLCNVRWLSMGALMRPSSVLLGTAREAGIIAEGSFAIQAGEWESGLVV